MLKAALDRYQTGIGQAAFAPLKEPESPTVAIKQVFDNLIMEALADRKRCGCFLVNSALELAPHDPAMAARSKAAVEGMITMFHQTLRQAQATEELPPEKDIRALARFLSNGVIGLRVMAKINPQREILQDIAAMTLAVITGGNSGIGLATAREFIAEGARVVISGRDPQSLDAAVVALGDGVVGVQGDVSRLADLDRLFATVKKTVGNIDILFINAGIAKLNPLQAVSEVEFDQVMARSR